MGGAYQKVLAKKSLGAWGAAAEGKVMEGRTGKKRQIRGDVFCGVGEPVRLIYANPTFAPGMRQRRDFDAHVLEYAALKIPALPFQAAKRVFCKFAQHQPSPSHSLRRV
ncbi:hypothetical protein [Desulfovibrio sp. QI0442]